MGITDPVSDFVQNPIHALTNIASCVWRLDDLLVDVDFVDDVSICIKC